MATCTATTAAGNPCKNHAVKGTQLCKAHGRSALSIAQTAVLQATDDPTNPKRWVTPHHIHAKRYKAVALHYHVNKPIGAMFGESDLATVLAWLQRYSRILEDRVRFHWATRLFLWMVRVPRNRVAEKAEQYRRPPDAGSIIVHDESEEWEVKSPVIRGADDAPSWSALSPRRHSFRRCGCGNKKEKTHRWRCSLQYVDSFSRQCFCSHVIMSLKPTDLLVKQHYQRRLLMIGQWIDKVTYPQLPAMSDEELEAFFETTTFARLGTLNEDGTIHIAPIFFKVEDGCILMATQETSRKIRNIKNNNKVTVLIDTTEVPFKGALIYGTAELDYDDVIAKRVSIFERRLPREDAEAYARRIASKWKPVIIRVTPYRLASFDYAKG